MATIVPAPAGTSNIAQNFATASSALGQGIGQFLVGRKGKQDFAQDVLALQQFIQNRQQSLTDPNIAQTPFPPAQSEAGADLFGRFLISRQQIQGRQQPLTIAQQRAGEAQRTGRSLRLR